MATIQIGAQLAIDGPPEHVGAELIAANTFENPERTRRANLGLSTTDTPRRAELPPPMRTSRGAGGWRLSTIEAFLSQREGEAGSADVAGGGDDRA